MGSPPVVELVAVGRELLSGRTVDTNSAWLAERIAARGARVARIVVVDDDPAAIAGALVDARNRGARLTITTGGLGPTFDDCTLAGVAKALDRPLVEHPAALAIVTRRYAALAAERLVESSAITPARRKMAALPASAEPVDNPVGTAPGVLCAGDGFTVLALPGVPAEMRAVFDQALARLQEELAGGRAVAETEIASGSGDESVVAGAVDRAMAAVPDVWIKSLPRGFHHDRDIRVRITAYGADRGAAQRRLAEAVGRLEDALAAPPEGHLMERFRHVPAMIAFSPEKMKKVGLVDTPNLFCDAYCLEPGQSQAGHRHAVGDKLYYVISGRGRIRVGADERDVGSGDLACAPAGEEHALVNPGPERLVVLVVMAPKPS